MSFFKNLVANVVEWDEFRDDMIFWKWGNPEIKKGSKLVIRPGQDAIFVNNGKIEGVFTEEGEYAIDSDIIPFLSTLKGARFGFNSGMRVEVIFVNTKEFTVNWGTRSPIMIKAPRLPGGLPVRANGTFTFKVIDYITFIEKIAGVREIYLVENVKIRILSILDQLLMKWISREGKDMFNLQVNAQHIADGIREDLDKQVMENGMTITEFHVMSFNYPEEIQDMITKTASHEMTGPLQVYQQINVNEGITSGRGKGGAAADMAGSKLGMNAILEMMDDLQEDLQNQLHQSASAASGEPNPKCCPDCGADCEGASICPNCGRK